MTKKQLERSVKFAVICIDYCRASRERYSVRSANLLQQPIAASNAVNSTHTHTICCSQPLLLLPGNPANPPDITSSIMGLSDGTDRDYNIGPWSCGSGVKPRKY